MRVVRTAAILLAIAILSAAPAGAAQAFVYVAIAAPPCLAGPCASGQLQVYDSVTKEIVTTVPLGTGQNGARGMAIAPDGRRLYISLLAADGSTSLAVFDTSLHQMGPTYPIAPAAAGAVTVTRDSRRVFIAGSQHTTAADNRLVVWDTQTTSVTSFQQARYNELFAHPALTRVVAGQLNPGPVGTLLDWIALDEVTGAVIESKSPGFGSRLTMSPDGSRLYNTYPNFVHPSNGGTVAYFNATTMEPSGQLPPVGFPDVTVDAPGLDRVFVLDNGGTNVVRYQRSNDSALAPILPLNKRSSAAIVSGDERGLWIANPEVQPAPSGGVVGQPSSLTVVNPDSFSVAGTIPTPATPIFLATTPAPGAGRCSYTVSPRQSSWVREGGTATITLSTGCAWQATLNASWLHMPADAASGVGSRTFDVTVDPFFGGDASRSASLVIGGQVVTFTQAGFGAQPAFGSFDSPPDNLTNVDGSLPVTGWALDDVGVTRVRIFRDPVAGEPVQPIFIGDATMVEGARPDVQAIFSSFPNASRAGWGYLLLTNMLPNGGNGPYRLHAYAEDVDGHTTLLGSKTITCNNSAAARPFGTIDTPGQGESVSGTIVNWGWVLTPQPGSIPADGSTIDVVIDGVAVGHPTYNVNRPDVAALFPGYANTNGAGGYFILDTTTLTNGLHQIAWVVRDNLGRAQGIGSRYFTVINP